MKDFEGRRALVTGGGTGLGRSMAVKLAERGAEVIVNFSRSEAEAEETVALCRAAGAEARAVKADVSTAQGARALAEAVGPRLDVLAANAGITRHARHDDLDALGAEDFLDIYSVNVVGPYLCLQALKPALETSFRETGRPASVLMTSSIAGVTGMGSSVAYAASKGALNTMTLSLARALAPAMRVNAVCPGFIGTRWFKDRLDEAAYDKMVERVESQTPLKAASGPDDIADAALFLLSDAARHVTGETLLVDAGAHLGFATFALR